MQRQLQSQNISEWLKWRRFYRNLIFMGFVSFVELNFKMNNAHFRRSIWVFFFFSLLRRIFILLLKIFGNFELLEWNGLIVKVQQTLHLQSCNVRIGKGFTKSNDSLRTKTNLLKILTFFFQKKRKFEKEFRNSSNNKKRFPTNNNKKKRNKKQPTCFVDGDAHCRLLKDPFEDSIFWQRRSVAIRHSQKKVVTFRFYVFNATLIPYASANWFDDERWRQLNENSLKVQRIGK